MGVKCTVDGEHLLVVVCAETSGQFSREEAYRRALMMYSRSAAQGGRELGHCATPLMNHHVYHLISIKFWVRVWAKFCTFFCPFRD